MSSFLSYPLQQNPLSPFYAPRNPSFSPGKHTCSEPRDLCDFPPFGPHLVCAQIHLSSEKGSSQLASSRTVFLPHGSASLVLAQPLVGPWRHLAEPAPGVENLLATQPRFPMFFLGLATGFSLKEFQVLVPSLNFIMCCPNPRNVFSILITGLLSLLCIL